MPIDLELVRFAMEDCEGEGRWFLDTETGEAVRPSEDDDDELREQIEEGFGERYIRIPYQGSDAGYRDMAEFIDSATGDQLRVLLEVAIRGQGAADSRTYSKRTLPSANIGSPFRRIVHGRIRRWLDEEDPEAVIPKPSSG